MTTYRSPGWYEAERIRIEKEAEIAEQAQAVPKEQAIYTGTIANTAYKLAKEYRKNQINALLEETQEYTIKELKPGADVNSTDPNDFVDKTKYMDKYKEVKGSGVKDFFIEPEPVMTEEYYDYLFNENSAGFTDYDAFNKEQREWIRLWDEQASNFPNDYKTSKEIMTTTGIGGFGDESISGDFDFDADTPNTTKYANVQGEAPNVFGTLKPTEGSAQSFNRYMRVGTTKSPIVAAPSKQSFTGLFENIVPGGKPWNPDLGIFDVGARSVFPDAGAGANNKLSRAVQKIIPGEITWNKQEGFNVDLPFINEERVSQVWKYMTEGKKIGSQDSVFAKSAGDVAEKLKLGEDVSKVMKYAGPVLLAAQAGSSLVQMNSKDPVTRAKAKKNLFMSAVGAYALYSPEPISKTIAGILSIAGLGYDVMGGR